MSMFSIFKKKKEVKTETVEPFPPLSPLPKPEINIETTGIENVRAKMDLMMTQLDNLNIRMETLNQRVDRIDRMLQEIYMIAKRG